MNALDELGQYPDAATLKPAVQGLCEKFGRVARLDVLTAMHEGIKQAICFLRMVSPEREQFLMKTLDVGRFGDEIVFVVDLSVPMAVEDAGPASQRTGLPG